MKDSENSKSLIMGVLNVTPDSFSDGGKFLSKDKALEHAGRMVEAGAQIIDIGGESTRPGSEGVGEIEEIARVMPVLEELVKFVPVVSIDTTKYKVAKEALRLGAGIINDISGLQYDPRLADLAAESGAGLVIMHMQGTPGSMQDKPRYGSIIEDISEFFTEKVVLAESRGVKAEQIILDPGIGFGKSLEDNIEIFRHLDEFVGMGFRILVGASRKSMIRDLTGAPVDKRLGGSLAVACMAVAKGAHIVRVHDVFETAQAIRVFNEVW